MDSKSGLEPGRLGIEVPGDNVDAASFEALPGLANASAWSFRNMGATGGYLALNGMHFGCPGQVGERWRSGVTKKRKEKKRKEKKPNKNK